MSKLASFSHNYVCCSTNTHCKWLAMGDLKNNNNWKSFADFILLAFLDLYLVAELGWEFCSANTHDKIAISNKAVGFALSL